MKLNCDMGEGFGQWQMGADEALMPHIDMANIACGFHASDPFVMSKTIDLAKQHDVTVGAHPGYPDLLGFGRRDIHFSSEEIANLVTYQVGALYMLCQARGVKLSYVKPHGALYNLMMRDERVFDAIAQAISLLPIQLPLMVLATTESEALKSRAADLGITLLLEAFCDRAYDDNGKLVPRKTPGSVLHTDAEIEQRIRELVEEQVITSINGKKLPTQADTICVHGDHDNAVASVKKVRSIIAAL